MADSASQWIKKESKRKPGTFYYFNTVTQESTWEKPDIKRSRPSASEVRALHILVKHTGSNNPVSRRTRQPITRSKKAAESILESLLGRLQRSEDDEDRIAMFVQLATDTSDCASFRRGGDLGLFGRGKMQKPFEDAAFALRMNELSGVVNTGSGSHILLRIDADCDPFNVKRAEESEVRALHILVKHTGSNNPVSRRTRLAITRSKKEAEEILRSLLAQLRSTSAAGLKQAFLSTV